MVFFQGLILARSCQNCNWFLPSFERAHGRTKDLTNARTNIKQPHQMLSNHGIRAGPGSFFSKLKTSRTVGYTPASKFPKFSPLLGGLPLRTALIYLPARNPSENPEGQNLSTVSGTPTSSAYIPRLLTRVLGVSY